MDSPKTSGGPNPIDVHVGGQVRARRILLGMSQEKLADGLGITFQQVQKYERGANRISASRLFNMAQILDVAVSYFYDGVESHLNGHAIRPLPVAGEFPENLMNSKETLNLLRHYYSIKDADLRMKFTELLKGMNAS